MKGEVIIVTAEVGGGDFNRAVRIAKSLMKNNYKAKILAWDRTQNGLRVERIQGCKVHIFGFKAMSMHESISFSTLAVFSRYLVWWVYIVLFLLKEGGDIYHPLGLFSYMPIIPIKIIKRKKVVYDLIDFVADSFNWPGLLRKLFGWLENFCLRFADGVIVVDIRKQHLKMENIKRLIVVPNCPTDSRNILKVQKDPNTFTIYYGGAIYETRGIRQICEAVSGLKGVKLVIAGKGPDEQKLMMNYKNQPNIEFKGLLSEVQSLEWTRKADLLFVFYDPKIPINRFASPAKLYDAMMCGTPVLVNTESLLAAETVKKEECGLIVPYGDIPGIRNAILTLKEDRNLRVRMGQNARKAFEREYNWSVMESRLIKLYAEVMSNGQN